MPTKYARAAGGNWNAAATWSTTSGGAADTVAPTAADDCRLDAASGNVTMNTTGLLARSVDCTGYTGTWTNSAGAAIAIGDGTLGAGNIALKFVAGMTVSNGGTSTYTFVSTATGVQTVDYGGKQVSSQVFNGVGGSWQFVGAVNVGTGLITLTSGTLDTNSQTISFAGFVLTGTLARTLTLGSSVITGVVSSAGITSTNNTNLTVTANTATFNFTAATSTINANNLNLNGSAVVFATSVVTAQILNGAPFRCASLTYVNGGNKTSSVLLSGNTTVDGLLTLTGSSTVNRILINSNSAGTARTITAGSVSLSNVDFQDTTAAGAASPFTGTSLGNALGNTNITTDTPVTRYMVNSTGNWDVTSRWAATSGGASGETVPLAQDTVIIDTNATGTASVNMPRIGKDVTLESGYTGTLNFTNTSNTLYGSLTFIPGATIGSTQNLTFSGRGTHTFTLAGKTIGSRTLFIAPGGNYTVQDDFIATGGVTLNSGTLIFNNITATLSDLTASTVFGAFALTLGTSTVNLSASGSALAFAASLTFSGASSTINFTSVVATTKTLSGGGKTFGTINYTAGTIPSQLTVIGNNTIGTLNIGSGRVLSLTSGSTNTVTNFNVSGSPNAYLYLPQVTSNYLTTPNAAQNQITGDITIDVKVALDDWTPAAIGYIGGKHDAAQTDIAWSWFINTAGTLALNYSFNGVAVTTKTSSVATGFTDGTTNWLRVTRNLVTGDITFFTSSGGGAPTWVQLGTTQTSTAATALHNSTNQIEVGSNRAGVNPLPPGKLYAFREYNSDLGTGSGTPVLDVDLTTKPFGADTFTESSSNVATVTLNGDLTKAGDGRVLLRAVTAASAATLSRASGTTNSDYLTIQDSIATGGARWFAGANSVNVSNNTGWIFTVPVDPTLQGVSTIQGISTIQL